jgi:hypothetical protein
MADPVDLVRLPSEDPERSWAGRSAQVPAHAPFREPANVGSLTDPSTGSRRAMPWLLWRCSRHRRSRHRPPLGGTVALRERASVSR